MSSKSTNRTTSRTSSAQSKRDARVTAQTHIDAQLASRFEESKQLFDYASSVELNLSANTSNFPSSSVSSYLQKIQRGSLIQPFGCLIAVDEHNFTVIAFSENAPEMLDLAPLTVPNIEQHEALTFGADLRTLFNSSSASSLQKAINVPDYNLLNPILVHCKNSGKPFYAILHRIDVGLLIDLEPVNPSDVPMAAGAFKSYKLAANAISRLQSLPSRNMSLLCDVLVKEVSELTGYDRVMVYKFHEDDHGEVISEYHKPDLEPYLGIHYPATDIPQASRFLFLKTKVRMICDCLASPVKVIQDQKLIQPLSLGGSILRAPHGCHAHYMANMGSIASLVMAVTINDDEDEVKSDPMSGKRLWGLVVCHHTSSKFISFPPRYACELLVQVFSIQVNKEMDLDAQIRESHILRIQTVLCDMLMRDSPIAIVTQSPNVMDLVKCDGASLYYKGQVWLLGVTPTEEQIKDITKWLLKYHGHNKGLTTDSLMEAGYPGASKLGEAICGMASVRVSSKDVLFWFRSHTAKEIKWGGAKHDPVDNDDGTKMHPRSSFKAFLEVVKWRSIPWEDMEMDAILSLQLILRGSSLDTAGEDDTSKMIVNVPRGDVSLNSVAELQTFANEMVRLIETAIVPIFSVDASGIINGWNVKVAELTCLPIEQAIGLSLLDVIGEETADIVKNVLSSALQGSEEKDVEVSLRTFGAEENKDHVIIILSACCNRDANETVTGVCFIGQDISSQKMITHKYAQVQGDYAGLMRNPSHLIPPIFMMDEQGLCVEWNDAMKRLSGFSRESAIGRMLLGDIFTVESIGCRVKDHDTLTRLRIAVNKILAGEAADKMLFGFFDWQSKCIDALLSASPRTNSEGKVTGVLCFLHVPSPELQYAIQMQRISEMGADNSQNRLAYFRQEMKNPVAGMEFIRKLMESSDLSKEQKQVLATRSLCEEQLTKIVEDIDFPSIEEGYMEMNAAEFNLGEAIDAVMSQVMSSNLVQVIRDSPKEVQSMLLYGDNLRLQQVLSDFMSIAIRFAPVSEGSLVNLIVNPRRERLGTKMQFLHVEFRIVHPSPGVPEDLIGEMFHHRAGMSREGLGLYISHKLVKIMDGTVQYLRGEETSSFIILLEFPFAGDITAA